MDTPNTWGHEAPGDHQCPAHRSAGRYAEAEKSSRHCCKGVHDPEQLVQNGAPLRYDRPEPDGQGATAKAQKG